MKYASAIFTLILAFFAGAAETGKDDSKIVRIGFFESRGMYNGAAEGLAKSGYCYDYMMRIAGRAGWKHEFRYGSFVELYEQLKRGEIDVLPYTSINEKRAREVLFSKEPMVDEEYYLVARPRPGLSTGGGVSALKGAVISTVEGWDYNEALIAFLAKNAPGAKLKCYSEPAQIWDAHRAGVSDATVFSSLAYSADPWSCLCKFTQKPAYVAIARTRPELKDELDEAMAAIDLEIPPVRELLARKYFPDSPMRRLIDARNFWNPIVISEMVSGLFLVFVMMALLLDRNRSPNFVWLGRLAIVNLIWIIADITAYSVRLDWCPLPIAYVSNFLAFTMGSLALVFAVGFAGSYFREMVPVGRLAFRLPAVAAALCTIVIAADFIGGGIMIFENGRPRIIGDIPPVVSLVQFAILLYLPAYAFVKRRAAGVRPVKLFAGYSLIPIVSLVAAVTTGKDFSVAACVLALIFLADQLHRFQMEKVHAMERANEAKSYFFSMVSHDIRTPLNAIIGYAELLKQGIADPAERETALESVLTSGHTLLELINDVLDLSKLEAGKLDILPEPVDVAKLVDEVVRAFRVTIGGKPLEIRSRVQPMPWLELDPHRVRQILFNLIGNSVKFTEEGYIEIRARYEDGVFAFEVEDTGCGIPEEAQPRICNAYIQVGNSVDRGKGTGLGLAICRHLVRRMGGGMKLRSKVGEGTVFTIEIPGVRSVQSPAPVPAEMVYEPQSVRGCRSVLVVDDQSMNRLMLKSMLERFGVSTVDVAANGVEALEKMALADYDLVLTDMWMPEMDGEALVKEIRKNPKWTNLAVYAVTADIEAKKNSFSMGFTGILLKPLTFDRVRSLLNSCI